MYVHGKVFALNVLAFSYKTFKYIDCNKYKRLAISVQLAGFALYRDWYGYLKDAMIRLPTYKIGNCCYKNGSHPHAKLKRLQK